MTNPAVENESPMMTVATEKTASNDRTVETRFGRVEVSPDSIVKMIRGPLGFEDKLEFAIVSLPDPRLSQFKMLQSMDEPTLSFIVTPLSKESTAIDPGDLEEARNALGVISEHALFLLIVTVRKDESGIQMSANLRAPIVVDTNKYVACQHVMSNGKYPIQQTL
jgi:flagellar assembly factor FliW